MKTDWLPLAIIIATAFLLVFASAAWPSPMVPGSGGDMAPASSGSGSGPSPPPSCSTSLAFNAACNSQYLGGLVK